MCVCVCVCVCVYVRAHGTGAARRQAEATRGPGRGTLHPRHVDGLAVSMHGGLRDVPSGTCAPYRLLPEPLKRKGVPELFYNLQAQ
jgi:hypothetical protein